MRYDDFVARVAERGQYPDRVGAEQVIRSVLEVLAQRLTLARVAVQTGEPLGDPAATAVLGTVAQAAPGPELASVLARLPAGFEQLFAPQSVAD